MVAGAGALRRRRDNGELSPDKWREFGVHLNGLESGRGQSWVGKRDVEDTARAARKTRVS